MLPTQIPAVRANQTQTSSARGRGRRLLLALVTLVLTVLTVVGIQALANRITGSPHPAVAVEALGTGPAAALPQHGTGSAALILALVALAVGVWLVVSRVASSKHTYWDDMPWS